MTEPAIQKNQNQQIKWQEVKISDDLIGLVPPESAAKYGFVPFEMGEDYINVAAVNDGDIDTQNALGFFARKNRKRVVVFPIIQEEFDNLLKTFKNPEIEIGKAIEDFEKNEEVQEKKVGQSTKKKDAEGEMTVLSDAPIAKMVEVILKNAIDGRASDIHIEPMESSVRVRYRVDGVLYNSISLPNKIGPAIVSRIKILSNLKIDEKRKPQDGRFRINDLGESIDFRVSTFPVSQGEKVVMRILDKKAGLINLKELGFGEKDFQTLNRVIEEPYGIVLVTGPTGSGKSTTLYSALKILNKEGVNIVTLEDPVEYVLEGIGQSQVKPEIGYTFASGLRSILRQDPDIVMVGEIRDSETAELAIHAALTGHLVLSTLHTNSAIGAIPRLVDMGIQPFLISSALKLVIGQRLVRKICQDCKEEISDIPANAVKVIMNELAKLPEDIRKELGVERPEDIVIYRGKGCPKCQGKGVKGRIGIFELLEVKDKISRMVGDEENETEMEKEAKKNGYTTMKQDGIIKVLKGMTTLEEVQRVTEDDNEEAVIEAKGEEGI